MFAIPFHDEMLSKIKECPTRSVLVLKDPSLVSFYDDLSNCKIILPTLDNLEISEDLLKDFDYIVIEDAEEVIGHPILYTVLDQIQYTKCKIIISTCKTDILDSFEKRIKSRFNNSVINLFELYSKKTGSELVYEMLISVKSNKAVLLRLQEVSAVIDENWRMCQCYGILNPIASLIYDGLPISNLLPNRQDVEQLHDMDKDILKTCILQNRIHPYITSALIIKFLKKQYQFSVLVLQQRMDVLCELGFLLPCELNWETSMLPREYHPFQCIASIYDLECLKPKKIELASEIQMYMTREE
eukprot:NODE_421_length_8910_cov_0.283623.p4 type:complete len:300 gc:universal NODE_421_length_8910_cov_0.283623:5472-6371(+)